MGRGGSRCEIDVEDFLVIILDMLLCFGTRRLSVGQSSRFHKSVIIIRARASCHFICSKDCLLS